MRKNNLFGCTALSSLMLAMGAAPAFAQVDEIIVTATKRAESTQDIAVAVTALSGETLEENNIDVFTDYLLQLPNVNAASAGPGQGTIFIRGISASAANTTTGVAAGLAPNVALYLDEQPVTQVGRNLDIYAVDLNRVEVLPGPQGTLFGASAQAGVIRLITNKPKLGVEEASFNFGVSFTEGGDESYSANATYNLPIGDKLALRASVFGDRQGGYIDNVPGEFSIANNVLFAPGIDASGLEGGVENNDAFVEDNFNDATYSGFRVGGYYEFDDNWSLLVQNHTQFIDAEGVFFADPELDSDLLSIQRFADDNLEDEISNTSWTLEGRLGFLDAVYTGAFNRHDFEQRVDYTDYNFIGSYIPFYTCNNYSTAGGVLTGSCNDPRLFADIENKTDTFTHELRFTTPAELPLRATFGGFYSDQENVERVDFTYPGSIPLSFPNAPISVSGASDPTARDPGVVFINDITRTDDQLGAFAELSYDLIPDLLTVTGGIRYYDVRVDFSGSSNFTTQIGSGSPPATGDRDAGFNLSDIFDGNDTFDAFPFSGAGPIPTDLPFDAIDEAVSDGVIFKANVTWTPNDDQLYYATFSQGFRPGVLNRPAVANDLIQPFVDTDDLDNYEIGWKTRFFDNQLQFNGSAFFVDISGLQTSVFDPINLGTNLFVGSNAADAEVLGIEADFIWAPSSIEGLTVNGGVSILDSEVTEVLQPSSGGEPSIAIAPEGSDLAFAPNFQGTLRGRYEWQENTAGYAPYVQANGTFSTSSFSDLTLANRGEQDSYFTGGAAVGVKKDGFGVEAYVENFTDERVEIVNSFVFQRERITVNRPRTWGLRFSYDFD